MADDVDVNVGVDYHPGGAWTKLKADMAGASASAKALSGDTDKSSASMSRMERRVASLDNGMSRHLKTMDKHTSMLRKVLHPALKLTTSLMAALKVATIGSAVALAGFTAATGGAKLALSAVNLATKAWTAGLKLLAGGAAVALGAVSMLAAAISELKAAASAPFTGWNKSSTQSIWNSLMGDPKLAAMGVDSIQSGADALMRMKVPLYSINKYMKELGDYGFYAGAGDAGKGLTSILAAMKTMGTGTLSSDSLKTFSAAFGEMAPNIENVGKAFVGGNTQKFIDFLLSNPKELSQFNNGLDELNNTLMGTIKTFRPMIQGALEPFGRTLNDVVKGPLGGFRDHLITILKDIMPRVTLFLGARLPNILQRLGGFLDKAADKFNKILFTIGDGSKPSGVIQWFKDVGDWWERITPTLERMATAWDSIWSALKPIFSAMGGMLGRFLLEGADSATSAADKWKTTGESIAMVFKPGGSVDNFLRLAKDTIVVLVDTLLPAVKAAFGLFQSPESIFQQIIAHRAELERVGRTLANSFNMLSDMLKKVWGWVLDLLPSVADGFDIIVQGVDAFVTVLSPVVDVVVAIVKQFGILKGIIAWLVGAAVLSKLMMIFGGSSSKGFIGNLGMFLGGGKNPSKGQAMGRAGLGALIGLGVMNYGAGMSSSQTVAPAGVSKDRWDLQQWASAGWTNMARDAPGMLTSVAGGAAAGAAIGSVVPIVGTAFGAGVGALGGALYNTVTSAPRLGDHGLSEADAARLSSYYQSSMPTTNAGIAGFNMRSLNGPLKDDKSAMSSIAGLTDVSDQFYQTVSDTENSFMLMQKSVLDNVKAVGVDSETFLSLADRAGVDLSDGALSMQEGAKLVQQAAGEMKTIGTIFDEQMEKYVYGPIKKAAYDKSLATAGVDILANLQGQAFDPAVVTSWTTGIMENYVGAIKSGSMTAAEGTKGGLTDLLALKKQLDDLSAANYGVDNVTSSKASDASVEVGKAIDSWSEVATGAQTAATEQQKNFDAMAAGVAGALGTQMDTMVAGLDSGVQNVISQVRGLSGMRITIGPDGVVQVTGGGGGGVGTNGKKNSQQTKAQGDGDTFTPRFAMMNTKRAHMMVDGSLGGRRSVTSMWRDYNLGSGNSDHVNGRALDITGDNLVSYAMRMRNMGGFAEFHGSGTGRHLHVVPPQLPMGDRPTPRPPTNAGHQPQVVQHVTTMVTAPQNMNEEMLARKIARHSATAMRDAAERS